MKFLKIFFVTVLIAIFGFANNANAAGFGDLLKNLGSALQKSAQDEAPDDSDTLKVSPQVQKEYEANIRQERESLKPTKAPPQSLAWKKLYAQREIVFYYDPAHIKQNGMYVTIPYMVDLPVNNEMKFLSMLGQRYNYKSAISVINYDCSRRSPPPLSQRYWRSEDHFFFTDNMGKGEVMMFPSRDTDPEWIEGFERRGISFEDGNSGNVTEGYFVNKVLNPELKICSTYWKAPEGYKPPKPAPYTQIKLPECKGNDMWEWKNCTGVTTTMRKGAHESEGMAFRNPGQYIGEFENGAPNGFGIYLTQGGPFAGDLYVGFFSMGNFSGYGNYYHSTSNALKGSTYFGYFYNHKKQNSGIYTYFDGRPTQDGMWEDDKFVKGRKTFYTDTIRGLPMCKGTDSTNWNDCFGYMKFEPIQGAVFQKPDGYYVGGFKDGLPNGFGSLFGKNGYLSYQGEFKNGQFDGQGTKFYNWYSSEYYSGGFVDDKRHGKGVYQVGGGSKMLEIYEGEFQNNSYSGKGKLFREEQFTYEGDFKKGAFDGYGVFTPHRRPGQEVVVKEGIWQDGTLKKPVSKNN